MKTEQLPRKSRTNRIFVNRTHKRLKKIDDARSGRQGKTAFLLKISLSIIIPTVAGILLGLLLDRRHPEEFSWTIALLIAGLLIGCILNEDWIIRHKTVIHHPHPEN